MDDALTKFHDNAQTTLYISLRSISAIGQKYSERDKK